MLTKKSYADYIASGDATYGTYYTKEQAIKEAKRLEKLGYKVYYAGRDGHWHVVIKLP